MKLFKAIEDIDTTKYILATYKAQSKTTLKDVAWNIAVGQSVGNPEVRSVWETEDLYENHSCLIIGDQEQLSQSDSGTVCIAFPTANINIDEDGVSHLLCQLMGGHVDIDLISSCRLIKLQLPQSIKNAFLGPKFGLSGFRELTGQYGKPLLGGIIKPKVGISPEVLLEMTKQLVDGGVDFIKEDEIMSSPACAPLERRVDLIANYLAKQSRKIVFCHTINCDPHLVTDRVRLVHQLGGNGVHINVFSGYGVYNSIRKLDLPVYLHFQSSGAKVTTDVQHRFSISWPVICQLATLMGVDTIQTGMVGGYSNDDPEEILECIRILREGNTTPALSCGFHPGLIDKVTDLVGVDYLANAGGAIHGHPLGTTAGAAAMRQAVDNTWNNEFQQAIKKWGYIKC